jgi:purine-binding chemotaxis protein CheW
MPGEKDSAEPFIVFELAGTTYALPSRLVQQMEMTEHITQVPNAPPSVEGVVFSRGQVIPTVNLRTRFGFEKIPIDLRTRLIVVNAGNRTIALVVDSAREFLSIPSEAIQPPNEAISGLSGRYLEGIATLDDRMILILNLDEVINLAEIGGADQQTGASI